MKNVVEYHCIYCRPGSVVTKRSHMNSSSQNQILDVQLLGNFRLTYGEETVTDVNTSRLQSLLAYLLMHRAAPQSRHHLAFHFWPDSTEAQALTNLRNLLYRLRRALPDADRFLNVDGQTLQWQADGPFTFDVAAFEDALTQAKGAERSGDAAAAHTALEEAAALYRGDLLPSCYDDWIIRERERLHQAFSSTLEHLILLHEEQREYRTSIGYAERLLHHDPLHEATYRRLMQFHALVGDRAGALRIYHTCATVLQRELAVEPSPATREAYERLFQPEIASPAPPDPSAELTTISPLVGRQREWMELRKVWRTASAGHPRLVVVAGEAGIGKTRLAEELAQWVERQGLITATARCYAAEGELAYAPVATLLRARPLPPLDPIWKSEVARVIPELLAQHPSVPPPGALTERWQRQRLFEALARAILGSRQPLLLLIDDLQWCDRETLEWLHYLMRFDPRARIMIVGTLRMEELNDDHPLTALFRTLRRSGRLAEVELGPLNEAETTALAESVAGREIDPGVAMCLYGETEGNPLFIVETVRAGLPTATQETESGELVCIPHPLPSRVQDALSERLAQLSSSARELVNVAATIGRAFTFDTLAAATELDGGEDELIRAIDELWQRRIVREQGVDAYDFCHHKLREVALASMNPAHRRLLRRHLDSALERGVTHSPGVISGQIARHEHGYHVEEYIVEPARP
jgi:DNA-binding SARP family transcriptional activator